MSLKRDATIEDLAWLLEMENAPDHILHPLWEDFERNGYVVADDKRFVWDPTLPGWQQTI
jgi:hypothetical protein